MYFFTYIVCRFLQKPIMLSQTSGFTWDQFHDFQMLKNTDTYTTYEPWQKFLSASLYLHKINKIPVCEHIFLYPIKCYIKTNLQVI